MKDGKGKELDLTDHYDEIRNILQQIPRIREATESYRFQSGLKLLAYRQEQDLTYLQLAEKVNDQLSSELNENTIAMMEFGDSAIEETKYREVMKVLGLKAEFERTGKAI
ncbi:hypothetical protein [Thermoactinomyces sp. DSM 45892]|uniref:hypothetical protein n=1 Tax=Thermoactinomyces sp. DSM 45892 TaxID=1882753 RepID=UPI00089B64B2|nr:hypothetical protein [Thermoactinomyces sp. DSM 45892]SDY14931.1 hypothetical protein SAMN05444416_102137 [Thermoactinomyces sp. DSM 45892]